MSGAIRRVIRTVSMANYWQESEQMFANVKLFGGEEHM
jgi:hypothetical protein